MRVQAPARKRRRDAVFANERERERNRRLRRIGWTLAEYKHRRDLQFNRCAFCLSAPKTRGLYAIKAPVALHVLLCNVCHRVASLMLKIDAMPIRIRSWIELERNHTKDAR